MRIAFFETNHKEQEALEEANQRFKFELEYFASPLTAKTVYFSKRHDAVFANKETIDLHILNALYQLGIKVLILKESTYKDFHPGIQILRVKLSSESLEYVSKMFDM